jgi:hypothetical protein
VGEAIVGAFERILMRTKAGGTVAPGFTTYSGQQPGGLIERLTAAGFVKAKLVETENASCVLAVKP